MRGRRGLDRTFGRGIVGSGERIKAMMRDLPKKLNGVKCGGGEEKLGKVERLK